jgi:hypothetical protein
MSFSQIVAGLADDKPGVDQIGRDVHVPRSDLTSQGLAGANEPRTGAIIEPDDGNRVGHGTGRVESVKLVLVQSIITAGFLVLQPQRHLNAADGAAVDS